jgi:hypothetical protein
LGAALGDGCANTLCAARHQYNLVFELEIHGGARPSPGPALPRSSNDLKA